ncbi:hypothetical protein L7F22_035455 [Adiantum nelumboides]|nr:hypothetical protein [Adiantum nelumboides]
MYAKCGALPQAQSVLEKLSFRDVVSWNALIGGYAEKGQGQRALECLKYMEQEHIPPDAVTYLSILKACAMIGAVEKGKEVHDEISRKGMLDHKIVLGGALVDMYAKCGALLQAQRVLEKLPSRDVALWNALITGYAQKGQGHEALQCYNHMQREGISPTPVTYVCVLKACGMVGAIDMGKKIHDEISRQGLLEHNLTLGNGLIDMYARCGAFLQAHSVLEKLSSRNVVSWSALIAGYSQKGEGKSKVNFDLETGDGVETLEKTQDTQLLYLKYQFDNELGTKIYRDGMEHYCLKIEERPNELRNLVPMVYSDDLYFDDLGLMYLVVHNPSIVDK